MNAIPKATPPRDAGPDVVTAVVLSRSPETKEAINRLLRQSGLTARCLSVATRADLESALQTQHPELVYVATDERLLPLAALAALRAGLHPAPSFILLLSECTDAASETALSAGAQDIASLQSPRRLVLVTQRELLAQRNARALSAARAQQSEVQRALNTLRDTSSDAIAEVAEGIVIACNPAWLALTGYSELGRLDGLPIMDCFEAASHAALRGALLACQEGRWPSAPLRLQMRRGDDAIRPVDIALSLGAATDGEAVITLRAPNGNPTPNADVHVQLAELQQQLDVARRADPSTGLDHRTALLASLRTHCATPIGGGVRYLAVLQLDGAESLMERLDLTAYESRLARMADLLRCHALPSDPLGRLSDRCLVVVIERGTIADVERWAGQLLDAAHATDGLLSDPTEPLTLSIGLARVAGPDPQPAIARARAALPHADANRSDDLRNADPMPTVVSDESDRLWAQRIKTALMDNRFRLTQQPIANLRGGPAQCYDLLVRLQDDAGHDVLPSEFLAAAQRHDLLRALDRWVLAACLAMAAERNGRGFFVRLSADSLTDPTLPSWLKVQFAATGIEPSRIVVQVPEADLERQVTASLALRQAMRELGVRVAIEHCGFGADSAGLIRTLQPEFVKIDGKLMQGLALHPELQSAVRDLVGHAHDAGAATIAERVEDANTMAVLFALGVESIQGRFVQRAEAVTIG
jgi:EAL domain-containing protein (putative c-di-GMP-specific phosphodiesterase class I)/PAS domain-containing protein